ADSPRVGGGVLQPRSKYPGLRTPFGGPYRFRGDFVSSRRISVSSSTRGARPCALRSPTAWLSYIPVWTGPRSGEGGLCRLDPVAAGLPGQSPGKGTQGVHFSRRTLSPL